MNKEWSFFLICLCCVVGLISVYAQHPLDDPLELLDNLPEESISQMEDQTDVLEYLNDLSKNPMDINTVTATDLERLLILNPDEIKAIIQYRESYGPVIDPHELQVIKTLSLDKLQQLLPFITSHPVVPYSGGQGYVLLRTAGYFPARNGYRSQNGNPVTYMGGPLSLLFKFRRYKSGNFSWGGSAEKDAGERIGFNGQPGFDHINLHYFKTNQQGKINTMAFGDYRINLGQGLLQYHGFAVTKSSNPLMVKRVAPVIQPYSGTSEYYFFRGAAIEITLNTFFRNFFFIHYKKRDATVRKDDDGSEIFSAFQTSGLHRTKNEIKKRNKVGETVAGHRIEFRQAQWHLGFNTLFQWFSIPYQPVYRIDNLHRLTGKKLLGHSLDFSGYINSLHLFGEIATQNYMTPAFTLTGLYSFHPDLDGGMLIRRFPAYFAPVYGNAFSSRSLPNNESGIYLGLNYHPGPYSRLSFYLDAWKGLWPTFQAHGPTFDQDLFFRYDISRRRQWEAYTQVKFRHRADNRKTVYPVYNSVIYKNQINFRLQYRKIQYQRWRWTNRLEIVRVTQEKSTKEFGILGFTDLLWNPIGSWWSFAGRVAYFDTDSFATRIYAYEPDIRYSFSIPFFYGRGWRLAVRMSRKWRNGLRVELRTGWTWLPGEEEVGSGYNAVPGSISQQVKFQVMYGF